MVSLSNQARLLAAQAFNKRVLEDKARAERAEIEAERRKDLARTTRRLELAKASARNVVERQRIQDSINFQLSTKKEKERRARINAQAKRESALAFRKVSKSANIGVLTGFEARKDSRGRTIGISKRESSTRLRTKSLLREEIARQQKIAREGTDLERFLKNEQAINQGRVSSKELKRQVAQRKARGLSKTPAQKRATQFFADKEFSDALTARAKRKGSPSLRATFGQVLSERARAGGLGSTPFADPLFTFGGRSQEEVEERGGLFGRRLGGESISSQLSFVSRAKSSSTRARIGFAQGLLSNLDFSGSSQQSLLGIVGNKNIKTPKTFEQTLRSGEGFFTTEAIPVTKPKLTKAGRKLLVARRKAEDFAKTTEARKEIARQARSTRQPIFDLDAFGASLDVRNLARGRAIEAENLAREPRFGGSGIQVLGQQVFQQVEGLTPAQQRQRENQSLRDQGFSESQIRAGVSIGDVPTKPLTKAQKRKQAQETQRETDLIRGAGIGEAIPTFPTPALVPATGVRGTSTETFFPSVPSPDSQIFNVDLRENIGVGDILSPPAPRTTTKPPKQPTQPSTEQFGFGGLGGLGTLDLTFGTGQPIGRSLVREASGGLVSGITNFFSFAGQGARAGDVSQSALDKEIAKNLQLNFFG